MAPKIFIQTLLVLTFFNIVISSFEFPASKTDRNIRCICSNSSSVKQFNIQTGEQFNRDIEIPTADSYNKAAETLPKTATKPITDIDQVTNEGTAKEFEATNETINNLLCNIHGSCKSDQSIAKTTSKSAETCLELCNKDDDCEWFTFFPDTNQCVLTGKCFHIDDSCSNCVSGQRGCYMLENIKVGDFSGTDVSRKYNRDSTATQKTNTKTAKQLDVEIKPNAIHYISDHNTKTVLDVPRIVTIRLEHTNSDITYAPNGGVIALKGKDIYLDLYGIALNGNKESTVKVRLTTAVGDYGDPCDNEYRYYAETESFLINASDDGLSAKLLVPGAKLPYISRERTFYFCLSTDNATFIHQGEATRAQIELYPKLMPMWTTILCIIVLLCLSGIFSGLNLGLMALDQTELKIVQNTGTESERTYANKIAPIRKHGNYLLCTLLLGNVLVNSTLTTLLNTLTTGLMAVIGSTFSIVLLGEIIPQAICSRHGLVVGANTIWLTWFFMIVTFPVAFPISKILDCVLGVEIGTVYDKKKLLELLRITDDTNDLEKEEVDIVRGALAYKDKTVRDVMTKLEDVYMLPLETVLDFETVSDIRAQGYSRIPIFDGKRNNIVHVLFAKDLMFIDPDDKTPVAMVCKFYTNVVNFVFHDTPLNVMFNEFKSGDKGHMALVQEINTQSDDDPFYDTIGLVTLEDIIEEIIQQEIVDETDVVMDNRTKKRRKRESGQGMVEHFQGFNHDERHNASISPQHAMAVFQYLTTTFDLFKPPNINDSILRKLLTLDVYREIKYKRDRNNHTDNHTIISKGKMIDFFVLIIEGRVEVNVGPEELVFESGPFTYFGVQALNNAILEHPTTPNDKITQPPSFNINTTSHISTNQLITPMPSTPQMRYRKSSNAGSSNWIQPSNKAKKYSVAQLEALVNRPLPAIAHNDVLQPYIPDYTVKAVSDVLYLRIRSATYIAAMKASKININSNSSGDMTYHDFNELLDIVAEDNTDSENGLNMRTPSGRSFVVDADVSTMESSVTFNNDSSMVRSASEVTATSSVNFGTSRL